jgi:hypothetical protein
VAVAVSIKKEKQRNGVLLLKNGNKYNGLQKIKTLSGLYSLAFLLNANSYASIQGTYTNGTDIYESTGRR